jgi:site-specific recombinase XerD
LGWLDLPYWKIDPVADIERVQEYLSQIPLTDATCREYKKGLNKLADYIRYISNKPRPPLTIHWAYYLTSLPPWLAEATRSFVQHSLRTVRPDRKHLATLEILGRLTIPLRWIAAKTPLHSIQDLTPELWFEYLEYRLSRGIQPVTLNGDLSRLQSFLHFLEDEGQPVCARMFRLDSLHRMHHIPRDVPVELLRKLFTEIQTDAASFHPALRRMGLMDHAWALLMLHSGMRTGEIRRLCLADIDWDNHKVRIEQSKGLKDRLVYLSLPTIEALNAYLPLRGSTLGQPDLVFVYRHQPLSPNYCLSRLRTYGRRAGVTISPHQLRHSCATLLLNAGAPVLTVKAILGHKHIDTTLGYARLYDGTIAADYYRAMHQVEGQFALAESQPEQTPSFGELLALVDALKSGTLNQNQAEVVASLRSGLLLLAKQMNSTTMGDVKVLVGS